MMAWFRPHDVVIEELLPYITRAEPAVRESAHDKLTSIAVVLESIF
jgi:hypothetical protein